MLKLLSIVVLGTAVVATASAQTYTATPTPVPSPSSIILELDEDSLDSDDDFEDESDSSDSDDDSFSESLAWGLMDMNLPANISTLESTYMACYRETHVAEVCPLGFEYKLGTCCAECPLEYPVECGMQCTRQNDDCTLEMLSKVSAVAQSALSLATFGACADSVQMWQRDGEFSESTFEIHKDCEDNVVFDVPITIMSCLGIKVSKGMKFSDRVTNTVELFVREVVINQEAIVSSRKTFTNFMKNITLDEALDDLNDTDISSLQSALKSNSTCGDDMKRLTDRVWFTVAYLRKQNPSISEDEIRVIMTKSNLMHYEIPTVTNDCLEQLIEESDEAAAYATRDTLRKTFGGIVDDLIHSGTCENGTYLSAEQYTYRISDKVLMLAAIWDPTNVATVVSDFFQSICGPTEFIGEVDDGSASGALGLTTVGKAVNNSAGTWVQNGDATIKITFTSQDTEKVTVKIMSGGDQVDQVKVEPGTNVTWVSNMAALQGKTLYLDRWRAGFLGFLGIPGTGGGSLLLWVPRSSKGGKLELNSKLNVS